MKRNLCIPLSRHKKIALFIWREFLRGYRNLFASPACRVEASGFLCPWWLQCPCLFGGMSSQVSTTLYPRQAWRCASRIMQASARVFPRTHLLGYSFLEATPTNKKRGHKPRFLNSRFQAPDSRVGFRFQFNSIVSIFGRRYSERLH